MMGSWFMIKNDKVCDETETCKKVNTYSVDLYSAAPPNNELNGRQMSRGDSEKKAATEQCLW